MSARITFRDDQCDLLLESLRFWSAQIADGTASRAHIAAGLFTQRRIRETMQHIETAMTKDEEPPK